MGPTCCCWENVQELLKEAWEDQNSCLILSTLYERLGMQKKAFQLIIDNFVSQNSCKKRWYPIWALFTLILIFDMHVKKWKLGGMFQWWILPHFTFLYKPLNNFHALIKDYIRKWVLKKQWNNSTFWQFACYFSARILDDYIFILIKFFTTYFLTRPNKFGP